MQTQQTQHALATQRSQSKQSFVSNRSFDGFGRSKSTFNINSGEDLSARDGSGGKGKAPSRSVRSAAVVCPGSRLAISGCSAASVI